MKVFNVSKISKWAIFFGKLIPNYRWKNASKDKTMIKLERSIFVQKFSSPRLVLLISGCSCRLPWRYRSWRCNTLPKSLLQTPFQLAVWHNQDILLISGHQTANIQYVFRWYIPTILQLSEFLTCIQMYRSELV